MERDGAGDARRALGRLLEAVLASRGEANAVFDILAVLQVWVAAGTAGTAGSGAGSPWQGGVRDSNGGLLSSRRAPGLEGPVGGLAEAGWESHAGRRGWGAVGCSPGGKRG